MNDTDQLASDSLYKQRMVAYLDYVARLERQGYKVRKLSWS